MHRLFHVFLLVSTLAHAEPRWDWSEPVRYQENNDPALVTLADGREVQVGYTGIPWDVVNTWERGRSLILGYAAGSGVVLFDPASGKSIPVLYGLGERHPIDLLVRRCLDLDETTPATIGCHVMGREHWDKELNRVYAALLASLDEDHRGPVRASQRQWLKFRDAEFAALDAVYDRDGTQWRIVGSKRRTELVRERAQTLAILYSEK